MSRCNRCDWQSDREAEGSARQQLTEHAADSGHLLCPVPRGAGICGVSLSDTDPKMACAGCLTEMWRNLQVIGELHAELPSHLRTVSGSALGGSRGGSDGGPLVGGRVLALLASGSAGGAARKLTRTDLARGVDGREHRVDNKPEDVASVEHTLTQMEDDWRHTFGHPAAMDSPEPARWWVKGAHGPLSQGELVEVATQAQSRRQVVRKSLHYLTRFAGWAADHHPGFDMAAEEIRDLRATLEAATHRTRRPVKAGAQCFECGGTLRREVDSDTGLEKDHVTCRDCGETYPPQRYALALSAAAQAAAWIEQDREQWATPAALARELGRSEVTFRVWVHRGLIRQLSVSGVLFVNVEDCRQRVEPRRAG